MLLKYDICIVGGGPGGLGAAIAAGRSGKSVILLEREGCLGGAAVQMLVNPFMRRQTRTGVPGEGGRLVNGGIFGEIVEHLDSLGGINYTDPRFGDFDDELYKIVCDRIVKEAGVHVIYHACFYSLNRIEDQITEACFTHNSGNLTVKAKVFIDATGDGILAYDAGVPLLNDGKGKETMPLTTMFAVGGIDRTRFPDRHWMEKRAAQGIHDEPPLLCGRMGLYRIAPNGLAYFNAVRIPVNGLDPFDVSLAEAKGREMAYDFVKWLRKNIEGAEEAVLIKTGSIGIRETRRIQAEYIITEQDAIEYRQFNDSIACSGYDFDIHGKSNDNRGDRLEGLQPGQCLQIPYRSLLPKGVRNLIVSCRALGAEILPFGSIRVQPPMMCIGHAAGLAAVLCLPQADFSKVDVTELRKQISEQGGIVE